jgi:hypothetical protein
MDFEGNELTFNESAISHVPEWSFLSENLQAALVEYLFSLGIRPEIGVCIEYLSWNKEQRLYMGWLRDFHAHLFPN